MADFGPCEDWPVQWVCDTATYSPEVTGYAVSAATRILWSLSGRRFGLCTSTLRPVTSGETWDPGRFWSWDGTWRATTPPYGFWVLPCTAAPEIRLPAPVDRITEVRVDGAVLDPGAYRLDNHRILVRTDGGAWPRVQNLLRPDSEPGTWSVTAAYGEDVPDSGRLAMGELSCEIVKASTGVDCRLPPGVTQLVRQGVTIQYPDVGQLLKEGRTGLYLVDLFLASENPHGLARRARVYNVDVPLPRRTDG
jgi:hypothetical protein